MTTQIIQQGSANTAGLIVSGAVVQVVPPTQRPIVGAATNLLGIVGTASWGPTNVPTPIGTNDQELAVFGPMINRAFDLGTAVAVAVQQGCNTMMCVRVTDGSDLAATANILDGSAGTGMVATGKYTGSRGNALTVSIAVGTAASSSRAIVSLPGITPETFDNITGGALAFTVGASTYTTVPGLTFSAPQLAGGQQAIGTPQVQVVGTPTVAFGGTSGFAANDTVTFSNGVVLVVNTVSSGVITAFKAITVAPSNAGSISGSGATTPSNPVSMVSTSGSGVGTATANLTWGLGAPIMSNYGTGYTSMTVTVLAGGGTITVSTGIWRNLVAAINLGQSGIRGPSNLIIASQGAGVGTPVVATTTLAGGADGVAAVTSAVMVGTDTVPRKGMYALRSQGTAVVNLADLADTTQYSAMLAFGLSEGTFVGTSTVLGDTIANSATELSTAGVDNYGLKVCFGDWIYWQDGVNNVTRLLAPATFWAGARATIAPQNSTLNQPIYGVVGTQKTSTGTAYTQSDLQSLITARLDVCATPSNGGAYFSFQSGKNIASNSATWGENYTMLTNFLAKSIGFWAGAYIGKLQTPREQSDAKADLDNFFNGLWTNGIIGNAQGTVPWQTVLNSTNNPPSQVAAGYQTAYVRVTYLSVIMFFVVSLEGGQSVQIAVQNAPPSTGF